MDAQLISRLQDLLDKNNSLAIAVGKNPTVDDMAAALSLAQGLQKLGKSVSVASPAQPLVEHGSLVGIDTVKSQLGGGTGNDLVVSFPYREGDIEKVSYTIEGGFLNIVVKAGAQGLQFEQNQVRYTHGSGGGAPQAFFIVGTPRLSDLGSLFDPEALKDTTIVNIDNKADNQGFGDLVMLSQDASSVSEMVAEMLKKLGVDFDQDLAQNLLNGVNDGTQNFQSPKTTTLAFETVTEAMRKGAKRTVQPRVQPQEQNEDMVSSFTPEHMVAGGGMPGQPRTPRPQMRPQARGQQPYPRYNPQYMQQPGAQQPYPYPQQPVGQQPYQPMAQQQIQQRLQQMAQQQRAQQAQEMGQPMAQQMQQQQAQQPMGQPMSQMPQQAQQIQQQPQVQPRQQMQQQQVQSQQQMPQYPRQQAPRASQANGQKPPSDWLTPKVYKGSSNVS